jgi:hypothetical protein
MPAVVYRPPADRTFVLDITVLGAAAFDYVAAEGVTLRSLLQGERPTKLFFDVRTDSDALYHQFGVRSVPYFNPNRVRCMEHCALNPSACRCARYDLSGVCFIRASEP